MKLQFNRYNQNFVALMPFINVWYNDELQAEVVNVGWFKWTFSLFLVKAYESN